MQRILLSAALIFSTGCAALLPEPKAPVEEVHSVRASAVLVIEDGGTSLKGRAQIAARKPGSFRVEVLGPFGQTLAMLTSDGAALAVFSEGRLERYSWQDPGLPFSFTAEELVSYLLGNIPPDGIIHGGSRYEVEAFPGSVDVRVSREGALAHRAVLSDFRNVSGISVPFSISIEDKTRRISIRYSEVSLNPPLGEEAFAVDFR